MSYSYADTHKNLPSIDITRLKIINSLSVIVWDKEGSAYSVGFNLASESLDGFTPAHHMPAYEQPYSRMDRDFNPTLPPTYTTTRYDEDEEGDLCVQADQHFQSKTWKRPSGTFGTPQLTHTPVQIISGWGFFSEYIQQCIFMFDSLPPIWQSLFSEAEMNQMQKEYENLQKRMDEEDCPF